MGNNTNNYARVAERLKWRDAALFAARNADFLPHYSRPEREMYTKVIIWLFWGIGLPAYVYSLLNTFGFINLSDAKAFILFALGALFMVARLVVYCVENYQRFLFRKKKLRNMK